MRNVIFDLDGTLADSSADLLNAANVTLEEAFGSAPLEREADALTAFAGGRAMLSLGYARLGVPKAAQEARLMADYQVFIGHYRANIAQHTRLYDGVEASLAQLQAQGVRLGVCTNKPYALAVELLQSLGIYDAFQSVLGADSLPVKKPDPVHLFETIARLGGAREKSVLIGDTITDRETARRAGIPCVLVGFGPLGGAISALEPDAILPHYDALEAVVAPFIGSGEAANG